MGRAHFAEMIMSLSFLKLWREAIAARRAQGLGAAQLAGYVTAMLPETIRRPLKRLVGRPAVARVPWLDMQRLGARPLDPYLACGGKPTSVNDMSRSQLLHTSLPMLLHWEDRDSMAHSVEARVPFVDYRLIEFTLGLAPEAKLAGGVTKRVLREAMRDVLPERVRTRTDKIGFATAEENWLRREQPESFRRALREGIEASDGVLRPSAAELLERVIDGREPFSFLPWRLISFGAWMRRFDVRLEGAA